MATKIEWCKNPDGSKGEVWNPVTGCTKVSAGCLNCYAERMHKRFSDTPFSDVVLHSDRLVRPYQWRKPRTVFVCSMGDLFHDSVPFDFVEQVFSVMTVCNDHKYVVLTKRPQRMQAFCDQHTRSDTFKHWPFDNVIIGTSIEDQATADERIPWLLKTPAACRMVSYEPALGAVDLTTISKPGQGSVQANVLDEHGYCCGLKWVVCGGEAGHGARPMNPEWARAMRDQCAEAGVPFFFKQWGEWLKSPIPDPYTQSSRVVDTGSGRYIRVGKRAAGHMLDGKLHNALPDILTCS